MANMSYCRFENTKMDLADCIEALEERNIKSSTERRSARKLLIDILDFCENEGIIEGCDTDVIEKILQECERNKEE